MKEIIKSKAITPKEVMAFVKEHKKEFLKLATKNWGENSIYTKCGTTGWQLEIKKNYMLSQPTKGDRFLAVGRAIQHWFEFEKIAKTDLISILIKLEARYSERIEARWLKKKPRPAYFNYTAITYELLQRGFINIMDFAKLGLTGKIKLLRWGVGAPYCFLTASKLFATEEEAKDFNDTFGIPGISEVMDNWYEEMPLSPVVEKETDDLPF